jgi:ankyrin repeat protein
MDEIEQFFNAASKGDLPALTSLLKNGIDVNARFAGGIALMAAATTGSAAAVRLLLKHGADVAARDETESTALHWAALYGLQMPEPGGGLSVIRALIKAGADITAKDSRGDTALDLAFAEDNQTAIKLLTPVSDSGEVDQRTLDASLIKAAAYDNHTTAKKFLEKGANVNARGNLDWTPLLFAVHNENLRSVKMYLGAGADPNVKDATGQTVLQLARLRNNATIADLLIAAGAVA